MNLNVEFISTFKIELYFHFNIVEPWCLSDRLGNIDFKGEFNNTQLESTVRERCLDEQAFNLHYPQFNHLLKPIERVGATGDCEWIESIRKRCSEIVEFYSGGQRSMLRGN